MLGEHRGLNQAPEGLGHSRRAGQESQRPTGGGLAVKPLSFCLHSRF